MDMSQRNQPGYPGNWYMLSGPSSRVRSSGKNQDFRAETLMEFCRSVHGSIVKAARAGENSRTMPNKDVVIVILAAGKGTRLKSSLAKVLHPAGGRSLVEQVVVACAPLKPKKVVAIIGHQADEVKNAIASYAVETVLQQPQNGTGHAM